ncbi:phospholipase [Micromonospora sp. NPDC047738]|uniref:phospholipase n=1 Tax=unclassified Micromonospora TaxID=2617518 RepID=UPI0033F93CD4
MSLPVPLVGQAFTPGRGGSRGHSGLSATDVAAGPAGSGRAPHSGVRERHIRDGVFHSAVEPVLVAGLCTVWWDDRTLAGPISVTGGAIAEFVRPTSASPGAN